MCPGQPWPLFLRLMAAMSSLWLIKHPLRSGSHGGWCHLSSGSCVMECGLLQSLSLRVINSAVASKARKKDTAHSRLSSRNQINLLQETKPGVTGLSRLSPWTQQYRPYPTSVTCSGRGDFFLPSSGWIYGLCTMVIIGATPCFHSSLF